MLVQEPRGTENRGTLAVFGDSIANGLGVAEKRFPVLLAETWNMELADFTGSALPVTESLIRFRESAVVPSIALIAHGATEAIIRPPESCLRFLPRRWRRMGWMDPRPYYSRRWRRAITERAESAVRWRVKNMLIKLYGEYQLLPSDEFVISIELLVNELENRGTSVIAIIEPPDLDRRYFPGSSEAEVEYFRRVLRPGVETITLKGQLDKWGDFLADRFHPNEDGHRRIAEIVKNYIDVR